MSGKNGKDKAYEYAAKKAADAKKAMSDMYQAFKRNLGALRKKLDLFSKKLEKMEDPKTAREALTEFTDEAVKGLPSLVASQIIQAAEAAADDITNKASIRVQSQRFSQQLTEILNTAEQQDSASAATRQSSTKKSSASMGDDNSDDGKELSGQKLPPPPVPGTLAKSDGRVVGSRKAPPVPTTRPESTTLKKAPPVPTARPESKKIQSTAPEIPKRPAGYTPVKKALPTITESKQLAGGPTAEQIAARKAMLAGLEKTKLNKATGNTGATSATAATAQSPKKETIDNKRPESMRTALANALNAKRGVLRTNSAGSDKTTGSNKSNKSDW